MDSGEELVDQCRPRHGSPAEWTAVARRCYCLGRHFIDMPSRGVVQTCKRAKAPQHLTEYRSELNPSVHALLSDLQRDLQVGPETRSDRGISMPMLPSPHPVVKTNRRLHPSASATTIAPHVSRHALDLCLGGHIPSEGTSRTLFMESIRHAPADENCAYSRSYSHRIIDELHGARCLLASGTHGKTS